jgi:hypothetical protein
MKKKIFAIAVAALIISTGLFAQESKKKVPKDKRANKEYNRKIFKNGKDTRFSKHKRKKFRKPGDDR